MNFPRLNRVNPYRSWKETLCPIDCLWCCKSLVTCPSMELFNLRGHRIMMTLFFFIEGHDDFVTLLLLISFTYCILITFWSTAIAHCFYFFFFLDERVRPLLFTKRMASFIQGYIFKDQSRHANTYYFLCLICRWTFASKLVKKCLFYIFKIYFIYFTILIYNSHNILIFLCTHNLLKYYKLCQQII